MLKGRPKSTSNTTQTSLFLLFRFRVESRFGEAHEQPQKVPWPVTSRRMEARASPRIRCLNMDKNEWSDDIGRGWVEEGVRSGGGDAGSPELTAGGNRVAENKWENSQKTRDFWILASPSVVQGRRRGRDAYGNCGTMLPCIFSSSAPTVRPGATARTGLALLSRPPIVPGSGRHMTSASALCAGADSFRSLPECHFAHGRCVAQVKGGGMWIPSLTSCESDVCLPLHASLNHRDGAAVLRHVRHTISNESGLAVCGKSQYPFLSLSFRGATRRHLSRPRGMHKTVPRQTPHKQKHAMSRCPSGQACFLGWQVRPPIVNPREAGHTLSWLLVR